MSQPKTAKEMRNLALNNLEEKVIEPYVAAIEERIERAALNGRFLIRHPFVACSKLSALELDAIKDHFRKLGYIIREHPQAFFESHTTLEW